MLAFILQFAVHAVMASRAWAVRVHTHRLLQIITKHKIRQYSSYCICKPSFLSIKCVDFQQKRAAMRVFPSSCASKSAENQSRTVTAVGKAVRNLSEVNRELPIWRCRSRSVPLCCVIRISIFFNRESGSFTGKSGFLTRKSGFFHRKLTCQCPLRLSLSTGSARTHLPKFIIFNKQFIIFTSTLVLR